MRRGLKLAVVVGLLVQVACKGNTGTGAPDAQDVVDGATEAGAAEVVLLPDISQDIVEVVDQYGPDDAADTVDVPQLQCDPGEGCFQDKCVENADCQSGWCVLHMGESVCSQTCQEECPAGWTCKQVAGTDPDVVYICVSDYANLCRPCADNADCVSTGGAEDACLDYGPDGNFCGGACSDNGDCPWGFSCGEAVGVGGAVLSQCLNDTGICPCTDSAVALGLTTPCSVTNEFGTCMGVRTCTEAGLTGCDAAVPAAEVCDGFDNDCDDETDEPDLVDGDYVNLCDDGNPCTEDKCTGEEGCTNELLDEGSCDDGDPCTVADHCVEGNCVGDPVECDDENPCTDNGCTETGGCEYPFNEAPCDDDNPCTLADTCVEGACVGTPANCDCLADEDCVALEDGDLCNGTLVCDTTAVPYQCVVDLETVVVCPEPQGENAFCLEAACDPATGECSFTPAHEGFLCDSGDACSVSDHCVEGTCTGGVAVNCNDGNPCTDDSCDAVAGCVHTPNDLPCADGDACTTGDSCLDGVCVGGPVADCNDNTPCTTDTCDPVAGCLHEPLTGPACDDGNACTPTDVCETGVCQGSGALDCTDDNPCTDNTCDPQVGCVSTLNNALCDDGDICTVGDHCELGACLPAGQLACDDGNECTDDSCAPQVGCQFIPNQAACDDGNACTVGDHCAGGWCVAGGSLACDDGNPCTEDLCEPGAGCVNAANDADCPAGHCYETECISNWALEFDGSDDRVLLGKRLINPQPEWTIEAWIFPRESGNRQKFIYGEPNLEFRLNPNDAPSIHIHSSGGWHSLYSDVPLALDTWHHIAASLSGTAGLRLFVDGELACSLDWTVKQGTAGTGQGIIGHKYAEVSGRWFDGYMDAVRLSKSVRYSGSFVPPTTYGSDDQTIGLWHFDDYGNFAAADDSDEGTTGEVQNCTWFPAGYAL